MLFVGYLVITEYNQHDLWEKLDSLVLLNGKIIENYFCVSCSTVAAIVCERKRGEGKRVWQSISLYTFMHTQLKSYHQYILSTI